MGAFQAEFKKFEQQSLGLALRSLSRDSLFVEHAEQMLDVDARLKLLERMALARGVPPGVMAELNECLLRARRLNEHRGEIERQPVPGDTANRAAGATHDGGPRNRRAGVSRMAGLENLVMPDVARINRYAEQASELQRSLGALAQKFERHVKVAVDRA